NIPYSFRRATWPFHPRGTRSPRMVPRETGGRHGKAAAGIERHHQRSQGNHGRDRDWTRGSVRNFGRVLDESASLVRTLQGGPEDTEGRDCTEAITPEKGVTIAVQLCLPASVTHVRDGFSPRPAPFLR